MNDPVLTEAELPPKRWRMDVNPPVFFISAGLILAFAIYGAVFSEHAAALFTKVQAFIVADFGWFYIAVVAGFLLFVIFLMVSRYGDIRLGPDDSEPDYSYVSWLAMLFSAGMGIGLVFFGVAEPVLHYSNPPVGEGGTLDSARQAMVLTFVHWGIHAWAIYVVLGLALAYFAFRRGLPLTIRSALYPLIGRKIDGPIGHAIDIFAVIGTMFGVATSLGLGVMQVNAGLADLFGAPISVYVQLVLIVVITLLATGSVFLGLDKGIKRLSELNITLAIGLLLFVLVAGSTVFLLQAYVQNIGAYLGAVVQRTFRLYAYEPNPWLGSWTLFYWGWWIAWSPFVGMFIARISRGRTIREFISTVLIVPVLFTFAWMTVFGNTGIEMDMAGVAPIAQVVNSDVSLALFEVLGHLPWSTITSAVATLLVITFFVTSADSGALVMDMITSGAAENSPVWQRMFWSLAAGGVASVLLVAGGLEALQTAAIASALPFAVVMIFICYGLLRALQTEGVASAVDFASIPPAPLDPEMRWTQRLRAITHSARRDEISEFLKGPAREALEKVSRELEERGLVPQIEESEGYLGLVVPHGESGDFRYDLRSKSYLTPEFTWASPRKPSDDTKKHYRAMASSSEGEHSHDVTGYSQSQLIHDLLNRYAHFRRVSFLT
uniref:BCCT family transporter n=1 Tax=Alteriqipengyuania halimionae TaxID=1926630 RepID=UPI003898FD41